MLLFYYITLISSSYVSCFILGAIFGNYVSNKRIQKMICEEFNRHIEKDQDRNMK